MEQTYFLGGYTKRVNQGISAVTFNDETIAFSNVQPIAQLNNPTWLTFSQNRDYFIALDKNETHGGIALFKLDAKKEHYRKHSGAYATIASGCHITIDEIRQTIYVSNYHEGAIDLYRINEHHELSFVEQVKHSGSSTHQNQQSPHVHMTLMNKDASKLYVCDLGIDEVITYDILSNGKLSFFSSTTFPAGTGPRHLTLHPTLPVAYLVGELNNTTSLLTINADQSLAYSHSIINTPDEFKHTSAGAAIRITKDGQFVYTSTRFHNILTVFKVSENGNFEKIQEISTDGEIPRDFILDASEQFVLVPHQDSDTINLFKRESSTGLLTQLEQSINAPECVNIVLK